MSSNREFYPFLTEIIFIFCPLLTI